MMYNQCKKQNKTHASFKSGRWHTGDVVKTNNNTSVGMLYKQTNKKNSKVDQAAEIYIVVRLQSVQI